MARQRGRWQPAPAAWPLAAGAQQGLPVLGYLASSSLDNPSGPFPAVLGALKQAGFEVGQTLRVETRYANFQLDRIPALAAELVNLPCTVIVSSGGSRPPLTLQSLTSTIPIVFAPLPDPVRSGLVASLNRPGGNITGVAVMTIELDPKRIELLHELTAAPGSFGVMYNPTRPDTKIQMDSIQIAAKTVGRELVLAQASTPQQIDAAFAMFKERSIAGLLVAADPFFSGRRSQIVVARHTARLAHHVPMARVRGYRRLRQLWIEFDRAVPAGRIFRCAHSQGGEAGRSTRTAADQIRVRRQPAHRAGARSHGATAAARPRRRADRITTRFAAVRMVANGTKRTSRHVRYPVAIGGKADIEQAALCARYSRAAGFAFTLRPMAATVVSPAMPSVGKCARIVSAT